MVLRVSIARMREPSGASVPPSVHPATFADRAAAIRLLTACLTEDRIAFDDDGVARAVELVLAQGSSAWLVIATLHGMPAGILLANPAVSPAHGGATLRIEALYVAPQHRGRGIDQALVNYVAGEARLNGLRSIEAEAEAEPQAERQVEPQADSDASSHRALSSTNPDFAALGFTPIDRRRFTRPL